MIFNLLKHLFTYHAGEVSNDDGDFLSEIDEDDGVDEGDEPEGDEPEDDEGDEPEDEDEVDDLDDDFDDEDDDEEDAESEDDPESEGDGGEEDGGASALGRALKEATRARLTSLKSAAEDPKGIEVSLPTVEDLKQIEGLDDIDEGDLKTIHGIVAAVVTNALTSYNDSAVAPLRTEASETRRKNKVIASYNEFRAKYPKVSKSKQDDMAVIWDEFSSEFGRDLADEISFEDLYIMAGGKGVSSAKSKVEGVARKLAKTQKARATRSAQQAGRLGKVRPGGKRGKKGRGDSDAARAVKHIRGAQLNPFNMP